MQLQEEIRQYEEEKAAIRARNNDQQTWITQLNDCWKNLQEKQFFTVFCRRNYYPDLKVHLKNIVVLLS